jgi:hypothetical protein
MYPVARLLLKARSARGRPMTADHGARLERTVRAIPDQGYDLE